MSPITRAVLGLSALVFVAATFMVFVYADSLSSALFGDAMTYYLSPTQLLEKGEEGIDSRVRLGGMVKPGLADDWQERLPLEFEVTDFKNTIRVSSTAAPPEMFKEGIGVVLEGSLGEDELFRADRVLVKHSNEYRVPDEGEGKPSTHPVGIGD